MVLQCTLLIGFAHRLCPQVLLTSSAHKFCSQVLLTSSAHKFCSQVLLTGSAHRMAAVYNLALLVVVGVIVQVLAQELEVS